MTTPEREDRAQVSSPRKGAFWRTVKAVAWSFIGLRKGSEYQQDIEKLHPLHIVLAGLVGVFLLVLALIAIVKWVT
jgi:hypothetical protein